MSGKADGISIQDLMEEYGLTEEDAAFAVRLAAGKTVGDLIRHPWPLPEDVVRRWTTLLVEQHQFTGEEDAAYLQGDRSMIDADLHRRSIGDNCTAAHAVAD